MVEGTWQHLGRIVALCALWFSVIVVQFENRPFLTTIVFICRIDQDMHGKVEIAAAAVPEWLLALQDEEEEEVVFLQPWLFASRKCLFQTMLPVAPWNVYQLNLKRFSHMLSETFLINLFFLNCVYCRNMSYLLAYWCSLVTGVSTHYLKHSVTSGWCMFCFITFTYIFIFKRREINIFLWLFWFI